MICLQNIEEENAQHCPHAPLHQVHPSCANQIIHHLVQAVTHRTLNGGLAPDPEILGPDEEPPESATRHMSPNERLEVFYPCPTCRRPIVIPNSTLCNAATPVQTMQLYVLNHPPLPPDIAHANRQGLAFETAVSCGNTYELWLASNSLYLAARKNFFGLIELLTSVHVYPEDDGGSPCVRGVFATVFWHALAKNRRGIITLLLANGVQPTSLTRPPPVVMLQELPKSGLKPTRMWLNWQRFLSDRYQPADADLGTTYLSLACAGNATAFEALSRVYSPPRSAASSLMHALIGPRSPDPAYTTKLADNLVDRTLCLTHFSRGPTRPIDVLAILRILAQHYSNDVIAQNVSALAATASPETLSILHRCWPSLFPKPRFSCP
jgi:hypothetical protein